MELWLCPRNKWAMCYQLGKVTTFEIASPLEPLVTFDDHSSRFSMQEHVDAFIKKHKAVQAHISGKSFTFDRKKPAIPVRDFDSYFKVRPVRFLSGFEKLTVEALINDEVAFLQFYVDRKGEARCLARSSHIGPSATVPGYILFNH